MGNEAEIVERRGIPWRAAGWTVAGLVLLIPLVAMQISREVNWTISDFLFAALMIGVVGIAFELTVRASPSRSYRGGVAAALAASFLIVWATGAVGMIGNEDNPYNLLFFGVIGLALLGSVVAKFRPPGMAVAMFVAAIAHGVIGVLGMSADMRGGIISTLMAMIWLLSAALFHNAARNEG